MREKGRKYCRICGERLYENGYDLLILEICWKCIPEYTPGRFITIGHDEMVMQDF